MRRAGNRISQPLGNQAVIEQMWHGFDDLGHLERDVIDNGAEDPNASVDVIAARL